MSVINRHFVMKLFKKVSDPFLGNPLCCPSCQSLFRYRYEKQVSISTSKGSSTFFLCESCILGAPLDKVIDLFITRQQTAWGNYRCKNPCCEDLDPNGESISGHIVYGIGSILRMRGLEECEHAEWSSYPPYLTQRCSRCFLSRELSPMAELNVGLE